MSRKATSNVYVKVIEDVVNKLRDEFVSNGGPGETALSQLQASWEKKMMIDSRCPIVPVNDLNYEGTEEYETPTTDLLFPPTPQRTPSPGSGQTPLPGIVDSSLYDISIGGNSFTPGEYSTDNGEGSEVRSAIPSQFMQPPAPWLTQTQRPLLAVNIAYDENHEALNMGVSHQPTTQLDSLLISSGKRKREDFPSQYRSGYISQQDGAGDYVSSAELKAGDGSLSADQKSTKGLFSCIPQADGPVSDQCDAALSAPNNDVAPGEDDELLNDDDDLDDNDQEDATKEHLIVAQYDKVSRIKNKWKCTLKDGIIHSDNGDILFKQATGNFEF